MIINRTSIHVTTTCIGSDNAYSMILPVCSTTIIECSWNYTKSSIRSWTLFSLSWLSLSSELEVSYSGRRKFVHNFSGSCFGVHVCLVDGFPVMVATKYIHVQAYTYVQRSLPVERSETYVWLRILASAYTHACSCRCLKRAAVKLKYHFHFRSHYQSKIRDITTF